MFDPDSTVMDLTPEESDVGDVGVGVVHPSAILIYFPSDHTRKTNKCIESKMGPQRLQSAIKTRCELNRTSLSNSHANTADVPI